MFGLLSNECSLLVDIARVHNILQCTWTFEKPIQSNWRQNVVRSSLRLSSNYWRSIAHNYLNLLTTFGRVNRTRGLSMSHCCTLDRAVICRTDFLRVCGSERNSRTGIWLLRFSSVSYCNCTTGIRLPRSGWSRRGRMVHHILRGTLCNRRQGHVRGAPLYTFLAPILSQNNAF